jgi:hypothetical protein
VGLKEASDTRDDRHSRRRDYEDDYSYRSSRNGGGRSSREVGFPVAAGAGAAGGSPAAKPRPKPRGGQNRSASSSSSADSDLPSSSDEERQRKKMRGKELLTAGLATVATIHAAHNVYQSMEKRDARKKALAEGEITEEEAKKERNRARLKDVASVGIAALGIKSAVSEWKEMKEKRDEMHEFREKQLKHHERRLRREERERRARSQGADGRYGGSEPDLRYSSYSGPSTYYDGNPYHAGALPPPPPGPPPARY